MLDIYLQKGLTSIEIVPHVTNAIQDWIERVSKIPADNTGEEPDVCIVEVRCRFILGRCSHPRFPSSAGQSEILNLPRL